MKSSQLTAMGIRLSLVLALFGVIAGCENSDPETTDLDAYFANNPYVTDPRTEGSASTMSISPSSTNVTFVGQTVQFNAAGGSGSYTWDVANTAKGSVTQSGLYKVTLVEANSVIVYDADGNSAVGSITVGTPATLTITQSPSGAIENDGDTVTLTAINGTAPYNWEVVGDSSYGHLVVSGNLNGSSRVYMRDKPGNNTVQVTDAGNNTASITIEQP
jgi:hypothetical protein